MRFTLASELLHYRFTRLIDAIDRLSSLRCLSKDLALFPFGHSVSADDADRCLDMAFDLSRKLVLLDNLSASFSEAYVFLKVSSDPDFLIVGDNYRKTIGFDWKINNTVEEVRKLQNEYAQSLRCSPTPTHIKAFELVQKLQDKGLDYDQSESALVYAAWLSKLPPDILKIDYPELQRIIRSTPEIYDPEYRLESLLKGKDYSNCVFEYALCEPDTSLYTNSCLPKPFRNFYRMTEKVVGNNGKRVKAFKMAAQKKAKDMHYDAPVFEGIKTAYGTILFPVQRWGSNGSDYSLLKNNFDTFSLLTTILDNYWKESLFKLIKFDCFTPGKVLKAYKDCIKYILDNGRLAHEEEAYIRCEHDRLNALIKAINSLRKFVGFNGPIGLGDIIDYKRLREKGLPIDRKVVNYYGSSVKCGESFLALIEKKRDSLKKLAPKYKLESPQ